MSTYVVQTRRLDPPFDLQVDPFAVFADANRWAEDSARASDHPVVCRVLHDKLLLVTYEGNGEGHVTINPKEYANE